MNHGPNGSLGTNILRQPHVKMSTNSTFLLPRAADPLANAYGPMVLLCSSVSSHSAAFRIEAVAWFGAACLVSKEGDLFPTTPAGYKPNVKPQWNDKNWLPIFQECYFLLSTFEAAIAHSLLTVQISQTRQWHNGTHGPCAPAQRFCAESKQCLWSVCVTISKILASKVLNSTPKIVTYRSCLKRLIVLLFGYGSKNGYGSFRGWSGRMDRSGSPAFWYGS